MPNNSSKRANNYAFIDSQNLNQAIRSQGWRLDYTRFRIYLKEKYQVTKAFMFLGYVPENQKIYTSLQNAGYNMIFKPILKQPDGRIKGNVDAELVLQTMIEYRNYDRALIITGDGDFYCLVNYLHTKNKLKRLLIPNSKKYSKLLKPFAPDQTDFMDELKDKLGYTKKRGSRKD